ncbi:MAG TPA: CHAT domain-containing protein [Saprospiraceae bacterium]|nr:CHAT domain-containing protein [Saprospiraceae bacterium]
MKPTPLLLFTLFCFLVFPSDAQAQSGNMENAAQLHQAQQYEAAWKILQSVDTAALFKKEQWKIHYWRIAGNCLTQLNKSEEARKIYEQVAAVDWSKPELQDTAAIELLLKATVFFISLPDAQKSMLCLSAGEKMSKKVHGPSSVDWVHFQMQRANYKFFIESDFEGAVLLGRNALSVWLKKHGQWNKEARGLYQYLINFEMAGSNPSRAIELINKKIEISQRIDSKNLGALYQSWIEFGSVYYELDQYEKAIAAHENAIKIADQLKDRKKVAFNYSRIGTTLYHQKKYTEAERHFRNAYAIYSSMQNEMLKNAIESAFSITACLTQLKKPEEADVLLKELIKKIQYDPSSANPYERVKLAKHTLLKLIYFDAKNQYYWFLEDGDERKLKEACRRFENAVRVLEEIHSEHEEAGSKQYILNRYHYVFEMSLNALFELYQCTGSEEVLAQAFGYTERSRAIFLSETLKRFDIEATAAIPDSLRKAIQQGQRKLAEVENRRYILSQKKLANDAPAMLDIHQELFEVTENLRLLEAEAKELNPEFGRAKEITWIKPEEVQKRLKPGEGWLSYFAGDDDMYAFLITTEGASFFHIPKDFPLEKWVQEMRNAIYDYPTERSDSLLSVYQNRAWELYEKLLAPFAWRLPQRLTIGADGLLKYLPFEALFTAPAPNCESSDCPYMLWRHSISYAPSATLWAADRKRSGARLEKKILAFAPEFQGEGNALAARDDRRSSLGPLLYNAEETKRISKMFRTKLITGPGATRDEFLAQAARYQVLHLATHAKANDEEGEFSFLAFAPTPGDTLYQGKLYARELYATPLPAELVVLSACETGIGEFKRGEGLVSLAYGFAQAGARSVVTSLWRVSDRETSDLMTFFYKNLQKGMAKDEALRQAKLEYMQGQSGWRTHPFFWAAFVPEGDMSPLDLPRPVPAWAWAVLGLLPAAGWWLWRRRRGKIQAAASK